MLTEEMQNVTYRFEAGMAPRFDVLSAEVEKVLESQKKVHEQANDALRLEIARYDAGTSTQIDVLKAQTYLTEIRTTQIQALQDFVVALTCVQHAIAKDAPQPPAT
jgi:outer membrane protein TolC